MSTDPYRRCVHDIMSNDVLSVHPEDTIHTALATLVEKRISALPVIDAEHCCVGILSATDLVSMTREMVEELSDPTQINSVLTKWLNHSLMENGTDHRKVSSMMTTEVIFVSPETSLVESSCKMLDNRVHRLPVLDAERHLVGIVSTMDILRAFSEGAAD